MISLDYLSIPRPIRLLIVERKKGAWNERGFSLLRRYPRVCRIVLVVFLVITSADQNDEKGSEYHPSCHLSNTQGISRVRPLRRHAGTNG